LQFYFQKIIIPEKGRHPSSKTNRVCFEAWA